MAALFLRLLPLAAFLALIFPLGTAMADEETCQRIGLKLHSVTAQECLDLGLRPSGGLSVRGTPILIREFPPLPERSPQARILLLGGVHGDEYSSISIVFKWMHTLEEHHSGLFHWLVAPLVNPDGLLQERPSRLNAHGVDLNRNFDTRGWGEESRAYWVKRTGQDPRRFPGAEAGSEPETRWVAEVIERFRPHAIISVHAPYNLLDFDGPPMPRPNRLGSLRLSYLGTFPGSLGRYAGMERNIPVITIELNHSGQLPSRQESAQLWSDLVQWLRAYVHDSPTRMVARADLPSEDAPPASDPLEASGSTEDPPRPTLISIRKKVR